MAKIDINMINTKFVLQAIYTGTGDPTVYKIFRHYKFKQDRSCHEQKFYIILCLTNYYKHIILSLDIVYYMKNIPKNNLV